MALKGFVFEDVLNCMASLKLPLQLYSFLKHSKLGVESHPVTETEKSP